MVVAGVVGGLAGGLAACTNERRIVGLNEFPVYPIDKPQARVLNVQFVRDSSTVSLTNTTASSFDRFTIWLNQEFSYVVDGMDVGQTVEIDLGAFRNHFGAAFRAGGFFATERPKNVVLAQIETASDSEELLGLVVVNGRARR